MSNEDDIVAEQLAETIEKLTLGRSRHLKLAARYADFGRVAPTRFLQEHWAKLAAKEDKEATDIGYQIRWLSGEVDDLIGDDDDETDQEWRQAG